MRLARMLIAGSLLAALGNGPAPVIGPPPEGRGPQPRSEALLRTIMLETQNRARAEAGVGPLAWNEALARDAAAHATWLAANRRLEHAAPAALKGQGETLWQGTRGLYRYDEMTALWVSERRWFRRGPTPDFSTTGRWSDVAHYTQLVWRRTREVGCALASNREDDVLVCRYWPQGNVVGVDPLAE